jgi:hypothetical protein
MPIRSIITVGEGRGFVVEGPSQLWRYVITVAHCLPALPPPHSFFLSERTYFSLLGKLGDKPSIAAECLFVDPVSDLAVLAPPDDEVLPDEAEAYEALVDATMPMRITEMMEKAEALLLSLNGEWFGCKAERIGYALWLSDATQGIESGMSGSPILVHDMAVGVVSTSSGTKDRAHTEAKVPALTECLPRWLANELLRAVSEPLPR